MNTAAYCKMNVLRGPPVGVKVTEFTPLLFLILTACVAEIIIHQEEMQFSRALIVLH
jgi:hypothetical protein